MPGLLSLASLLSGFNGGASQVAPWFLGQGDFPFLNLMKTGGSWNYSNNQGLPSPAELNSDGYPITIIAGTNGLKSLCGIFPPAIRTGVYVVTWSGNGTIALGIATGGSTITANTGYTSANLTSTTGSGRYEFTTTEPSAISIGISAIGTPVITNVQFFLKADETALNAGQVFGTQFLSILRSGNPGVLRFLDWCNINGTNLTTWATRKPTTYFSYAPGEYRSAIYTGPTTNTGFKFNATLGTGGPVDKQTIHTRFQPTSVSVSIDPTAAVCTWTSHGLNVGASFLFSVTNGVVLPTNVATGVALVPSTTAGARQVYWVTNVIDSNNFNFASSKGGSNITTSGSQTGTPEAAAYPVAQSVTLTAGANSTVTWTNHGLNINDPVSLIIVTAGGTWPSGLWGSKVFYVSATSFSTSSFQFSLTPGGASVNMTGAVGSFNAYPVQTFNLNGTGDVPLLAPWGDPNSGLNSAFCSAVPLYGTLVYDADLGGWLKFGSDSGGASGLAGGVPVEVCVQLCTAIGAHPHFPSPFLAVDPMTDWHTQLATYIQTNGPTWMKPRFEGCNETWNNALGFYATRYAWNKAPVHWGSTFWQANDDWYGKTISTIGQAVNAVYGGTPGTQTGYAVICGVQTSSAQVNGIFPNAGNSRLASTQYVAQAAAPQSGYLKSAGYNWASHVCLANYWSPGERNTPQEVADAFNYAVTNAGNATAQNTIADSWLGTANTGCNFTASLSLGTMIVTAIAKGSGNLLPGALCFNQANTITNTQILSQSLGTTGGVGTYSVSGTQVIASGPMFTTGVVAGASAGQDLIAVQRLASQCQSWASTVSGGLVTRMCGYEGGYSPDYPTHDTDITSSIATPGITQDATGAVVTVGTFHPSSSVWPVTGNGAAVVGMPIVISGVNGMTQINNAAGFTTGVTVTAGTPGNVLKTAHGFSSGQSFYFEPNNSFTSFLPTGAIFGQAYYVATVIDANNFTFSATSGGAAVTLTGSASGVNSISLFPCWVITSIPAGGTTIKLNVDSSGFSPWTSGGSITYGPLLYLLTIFTQAAKFRPILQTLTTQLYNDFAAVGGEFPSCYVFAGTGAVWPVWDPNIFNSSIPPQWAAITAFNT